MDLASLLRAEIESLERELRADPRHVKLRDLRNALAHYEPPPSAAAHDAANHRVSEAPTFTPQSVSSSFALQPKGGRRRTPERQHALDTAWELLKDRKAPTTTAEIYEHLISLGIEVGGQSPKGNLSAMLFKDGRFRSHGRAGFILPENDVSHADAESAAQENEPSDVSPSDGSDTGSEDERPEGATPLMTYPFHPVS